MENVTQKAATSAMNFSALDSILAASWPVQLTLLILAGMSVFSWAIIVAKRKSILKIRSSNSSFLDVFWRTTSLDDLNSKLSEFPDSNLARVFLAGYLELRKIADSNLAKTSGSTSVPSLSGMDNLERSLRKAIDVELTRLEMRLSFLATTGSTGPFIGLFGTVWGIMGAFHKIGATGMASLAVVAPGISESLIATAIGLVSAIPATVAYNHFASEIQRETIELNNFASDFLNIAKRNFFKDK